MATPLIAVVPPRLGGSYERNLKSLRKSFPSVDADVAAEITRLQLTPDRAPYAPPNVTLVPGFGREMFKVRVSSSDQGKGKSGGFRMLFLRAGSGEWRPVAIYVKAQSENLAHETIKAILKEEAKAEAREAASEPSSDPGEIVSPETEDSSPSPKEE